ncbi:MAG: hypothetical protein ACE5JD_15735 [Candidatus Methylomirabilia bacterium]
MIQLGDLWIYEDEIRSVAWDGEVRLAKDSHPRCSAITTRPSRRR